MKFIITTTYDHIDDEWLAWYLKRLGNENVLPGGSLIVSTLKSNGKAEYSSEDPTSQVVGTTTYEIIK